MLTEVKKCAENHDIKGLRYIFVDSLDVDPTFDTYREDYNYCKTIPGMFDSHKELTLMDNNKEGWTSGYWEQLKLDLMKNFSEKRFDHMISVAKVVYSDKIARLMVERGKKNMDSASKDIIEQSKEQIESANDLNFRAVTRETGTVPASVKISVPSQADLQKQRIEAQKKALDAENKRIEAEQRAQQERIETAKRMEIAKQNSQSTRSESKKALGIVLAVIMAIVVVVFILIVLH